VHQLQHLCAHLALVCGARQHQQQAVISRAILQSGASHALDMQESPARHILQAQLQRQQQQRQ
jgi:hypothetical protein